MIKRWHGLFSGTVLTQRFLIEESMSKIFMGDVSLAPLYSARSASTGSKRAALRAGNRPAASPIIAARTSAAMA